MSSNGTPTFITRYLDLFVARQDTYAIRIESRERPLYVPSTYSGESEWTHEQIKPVIESIGTDYGLAAVTAHLKGEAFLGIYPIQEDSTVQLFCMDFDGESPEEAWEAAKDQYTVLQKEAGLEHVYLERSRSGNGWHIWCFLSDAINAGRLRHALQPFIVSADTYDRMFPNQDSVDTARPLGNLVALPLYGPRVVEGKGCFVVIGEEGQPVTVQNQKEFLMAVKRVDTDILENLFAQAKSSYVAPRNVKVRKPEDTEGLSGGWKVTHRAFGCEWILWAYDNPTEVGEPEWWCLAHQFAQLEGGRTLFHEWSSQDPARYNVRDTDRKFDQAVNKNAPPRCDYIRTNLAGPSCNCDSRFPGDVYHPYELAKIDSQVLAQSVQEEQRVHVASDGFEYALEWAKYVHKNPEEGAGIRYGLQPLDEATRMRNSELIIAAARPGMGKTAWSLWVGHNVAKREIPVYFFSMEMSHEQLWKRLICTAAGVSATSMATGQLEYSDWRKLHKARDEIKTNYYPFFVDDVTNHTSHILDLAGDLALKNGKGVIMVDYLQLASKLPKENMFDKVTRVAHELKTMAKTLNMPVVALTQLNRSADDATNDSQTYDSWLRGSGDIEQVADVILFMLGEKGKGVKERNIVVHKERHRESGIRVISEFNQNLMQFGPAGTWLHGKSPIFSDGNGDGSTTIDQWTKVVGEEAANLDWGL
jgi:KaiC/GvpD/RAD55 family RecA-like ATPase